MQSLIAIHDLCLYSKSSLSIVLPVAEAMGIEVFSLPTAILSTQSDGYSDLIYHDMSSLLLSYYEKIKSYGYSFNAIYSGYLGRAENAESVKEIIKKENALSLVDPVFADSGELYQGLGEDLVDAIRELVESADIITPNLSEASFLTGQDIKESYNNRDVNALIKDLKMLGPTKGVVTSVPLEIGKLANIAYDSEDIRIFSYDDLDVSYPGSGDLFASLLISLLLSENSFFPSVRLSGEITTRALRYNKEIKRERRLGINLSSVMNDIRSLY